MHSIFQHHRCTHHFLISTFGLVLFVCLTQQTVGQTNPNESSQKQGSGKFGLDFQNNVVYYGRKDSINTPYLTPSLGYYDPSGFYISGSLSYLMEKKGGRIDLSSIDLGYEHAITESLFGSIYANKSWYNQSSSNIKNNIKGSIGGSLNYDVNVAQINGGIDMTFSDKTDLGFNIGLSHLFELGADGNQFSIEPAITANWNTLHSYEGYLSKKIGKRQNTGLPANTVITASTSVLQNKLTLLDYECAIPFKYESKTFELVFTPTLAIPQNPIYTSTTITTKLNGTVLNNQTIDSTPSSEKTLTNNFFTELSLYVKF